MNTWNEKWTSGVNRPIQIYSIAHVAEGKEKAGCSTLDSISFTKYSMIINHKSMKERSLIFIHLEYRWEKGKRMMSFEIC